MKATTFDHVLCDVFPRWAEFMGKRILQRTCLPSDLHDFYLLELFQQHAKVEHTARFSLDEEFLTILLIMILQEHGIYDSYEREQGGASHFAQIYAERIYRLRNSMPPFYDI